MGFLSRLLGIRNAAELEGITLGPPPHWRLVYHADSASFFRALPLLLPAGAVLYFECPLGNIGPAFLEKRAIEARVTVRPETLSRKVTFYHLEMTQDNVAALAEILDSAVVPFPSGHFHAYKDDKILLFWPDAFDNPFFVSAEVEQDKVARFCDATGCVYTMAQPASGG